MAREENSPSAGDVRVGKDILELVSSAMYVEPLTAYREYLQNAADSIEEAHRQGLLGEDQTGRVEISLDQQSRTVRIRDNGAGIPRDEALGRLLALGGSNKRGTGARGFRGVGRLAALGYAQYLTFRTRAPGDDVITEVTWDGRRLRDALTDAQSGDLTAVVASVVDVRELPVGNDPLHFFEVELGRIVRQRGDRLLDPSAVQIYIAQVGPVPFATEFKHGAIIVEALRGAGPFGEFEITVDGGPPITRPHRDSIPLGGSEAEIHDLKMVEIPGANGGLAAVGWFGHHDYKGAIPAAALVKGVRIRVGNIQVGDQNILEQIFPETRFNSWTVGEIHILDRRIVPNGRRDDFEPNGHYANLINHLSPVGRDIALRCRTSSSLRSKLREFDRVANDAIERLAVVEQGAMSDGSQAVELGRIGQAVTRMHKVMESAAVGDDTRGRMSETLRGIETELERIGAANVDPLCMVAEDKRETYRHVFGLIYECAANRIAAKSLIDKIIERLAA